MGRCEALLPVGKVANEILLRYVFNKPVEDPSILLGPGLGEDAAVVRVGDSLLVLKSDPITGAVENIGWLAVHINANDVATRGAVPKWFLATILLPENCEEQLLAKIFDQISLALSELNAFLVGGHTEVCAGLNRPIVVGSMAGLVKGNKFFTSSGAKPGDAIVLTKTVGIEGTAVLASDYEQVLVKELGEDLVAKAKLMIKQISVVKDCLTAIEVEHVSAIHDLTEGGLTTALYELSEASNVGFKVELSSVPIADVTLAICEALKVNPYQLVSSGAVLITVEKSFVEELISKLKEAGVKATVIGEVVEKSSGRLFLMGGKPVELRVQQEELWKVFKEYFR